MKKPYFVLINCLLIVLGAYWGVDALYQAASAQLKDTPPLVAPTQRRPQQADTVQQPLAYYKEVAERNLFGVKAEEAKSMDSVNLESLEQTDLKLKLWGTVTGQGSGVYAVIEDTQSRTQNLYRKDDTVQGAVVKMILREKIVLRVGAKDQMLEMEKGQGGKPVEDAIPENRFPLPVGNQAARTISLQRSQIEEAMSNVNDLMQQVKIMPHFSNGQSDGFSLTGIRPNSIFRKMGLRNGDVITGVNGNRIETMDDALGFYKQLSASDSVSVQMKRRGRESTLEYQIK